jgi:hypothetical protein
MILAPALEFREVEIGIGIKFFVGCQLLKIGGVENVYHVLEVLI